jgi:hypothetical protein
MRRDSPRRALPVIDRRGTTRPMLAVQVGSVVFSCRATEGLLEFPRSSVVERVSVPPEGQPTKRLPRITGLRYSVRGSVIFQFIRTHFIPVGHRLKVILLGRLRTERRLRLAAQIRLNPPRCSSASRRSKTKKGAKAAPRASTARCCVCVARESGVFADEPGEHSLAVGNHRRDCDGYNEQDPKRNVPKHERISERN